jgi:hypothetical protein
VPESRCVPPHSPPTPLSRIAFVDSREHNRNVTVLAQQNICANCISLFNDIAGGFCVDDVSLVSRQSAESNNHHRQTRPRRMLTISGIVDIRTALGLSE